MPPQAENLIASEIKRNLGSAGGGAGEALVGKNPPSQGGISFFVGSAITYLPEKRVALPTTIAFPPGGRQAQDEGQNSVKTSGQVWGYCFPRMTEVLQLRRYFIKKQAVNLIAN